MTKPQTDYSEMIETWRIEREAAFKTARADLRAALRKLSVTEVVAEYEGYGDSGNVEDITLQPNDVTLGADLWVQTSYANSKTSPDPVLTISIPASRTTKAAMAH
ncbi:DUF6878 family protein [Tateyamaria omphalii]|uniref:DUF6878 family protein n=1 Tax=Tateyamaria omphalii TaxID=299262 RepID=UPI0021BD4150|nr:DUF6878 family protein [Tateyamaria omphalii]